MLAPHKSAQITVTGRSSNVVKTKLEEHGISIHFWIDTARPHRKTALGAKQLSNTDITDLSETWLVDEPLSNSMPTSVPSCAQSHHVTSESYWTTLTHMYNKTTSGPQRVGRSTDAAT